MARALVDYINIRKTWGGADRGVSNLGPFYAQNAAYRECIQAQASRAGRSGVREFCARSDVATLLEHVEYGGSVFLRSRKSAGWLLDNPAPSMGGTDAQGAGGEWNQQQANGTQVAGLPEWAQGYNGGGHQAPPQQNWMQQQQAYPPQQAAYGQQQGQWQQQQHAPPPQQGGGR